MHQHHTQVPGVLHVQGVDALVYKPRAKVGEDEAEQRTLVDDTEEDWCRRDPGQQLGEEDILDGEDGKGDCGIQNLGKKECEYPYIILHIFCINQEEYREKQHKRIWKC